MNNAITKSAIQVANEFLEVRLSFEKDLKEILEKYEVKNNIFVCNSMGMAEECHKGYYGELNTYPTLEEAVRNCNIISQGIRIHDGQYSIGNLYNNLRDVNESLVVDCEKSIIL